MSAADSAFHSYSPSIASSGSSTPIGAVLKEQAPAVDMHADPNPPTSFTGYEWATVRGALFNFLQGKTGRARPDAAAYTIAISMDALQAAYRNQPSIVAEKGLAVATAFVVPPKCIIKPPRTISGSGVKEYIELLREASTIPEREIDALVTLHSLAEKALHQHTQELTAMDKPKIADAVFVIASAVSSCASTNSTVCYLTCTFVLVASALHLLFSWCVICTPPTKSSLALTCTRLDISNGKAAAEMDPNRANSETQQTQPSSNSSSNESGRTPENSNGVGMKQKVRAAIKDEQANSGVGWDAADIIEVLLGAVFSLELL